MANRQEVRLVTGKPLRLRMRRSVRARRLTVHVGPRQGVEVVMPRWATLADVDSLLNEHEGWLARQADTHGVWNGPRTRSWASGDVLTLLGDELILDLLPLPPGRQRMRVTTRPGSLCMELPPEDILDPRPAMIRWLKGYAGKELRRRTEHWAQLTGLVPARVVVGERTSRWGSCSWRGTISLCYRLVLGPSDLVDAVVVHELCHLVEPNHGPRFKRLVRAHYPDHDHWMEWLRQSGHLLEV